MRGRKWKACRFPTLLEIHQAHYSNFGTLLPLHEEADPEGVDRVLAWRAALPSERTGRDEGRHGA